MAPCLAHAATIHISAVRVGLAPDHVRLVLESDAAIQARLVRPTAPGQLAVDLDGVVANAVLASLPGKVGRANPYLRHVRVVRGEAGEARITFVSTTPVTPQIFQLNPGDGHAYRLVLDFYPDELASPPTLPAGTKVLTPVRLPFRGQRTPLKKTERAPQENTPARQRAPANTRASATTPRPRRQRSTSSPATPREAWLQVSINGLTEGTSLVLQGPAGVRVSADDVTRWRLRRHGIRPKTTGGIKYYLLNSFDGLSYHIDEARQALQITLPPSAFQVTRFSATGQPLVEPTPSAPGAYISYDASASSGNHGGTNAAALIDLGLFNRWGQFDSTTLARHGGDATGTLRLDSTWTHDMPAKMASVRLGDAISGVSQWGRSVRFGGVQWASNFGTQPSLITFPMPTLEGSATMPSTVDVYVNNALRLRRSVPSGPFSIQDLPVITGKGEVRMVVRDALGREQTISEPFYASGGLLAPGLRDYSYDLGFVRRNYGLQSNEYGPPLLAATERRGLSDSFTGELHGEVTPDQQTLGAGGTWLVSTLGSFTASVAGSHGTTGHGALLGVGFQHQASQVSFGARSQWTTANFTELGNDPVGTLPRQNTTAYLSVSLSQQGSLGANYTYQDFTDRPDIALVGLSYNRSMGRLGYLGISALHFLGSQLGTVLGLTFTTVLGPRDSLSISGQSQGGAHGGNVQYQRNVPVGNGVGYRLQAGLTPSDPSQIGVTAQNDVGTYSLQAASAGDMQDYRAGAQGSVVLMDGQLFASRHIDDSFAVVQVPGFAHVRVYADNQPVATTDARGYALVPSLRSYEDNPIRIEQADLPLDATIETLQLEAVPYRHSGVLLSFPVSRSRGALVTLTLPGHGMVPAGAEVTLQGSATVFPVGERGEVYLTGLVPINHLQVRWPQHSCVVNVPFPKSTDPLPRLGPLSCIAVTP